MGILGSMPRDPAQHIGTLQKKMIALLGREDLLTPEQRKFVLGVYCYYQERNRVTRQQAAVVVKLWKERFEGPEAVRNVANEPAWRK